MSLRLVPVAWVGLLLLLAGCDSSEDRWRRYHDDAEDFLENGRHVEAILQFRNALSVKPDQPQSLRGLATAYRRTGQWAEALATLDRLTVADPEADLLLERARYALADEKPGLARRHVYDHRVDHPNAFEALVLAGWLARSEARRENAHQQLAAELRKAAAKPVGVGLAGLPLEMEAQLALSLLDESLGRRDAASARLETLPETQESLVEIRRGELAAAGARWNEALASLTRARALAEREPKRVEHQLYLTGQWRAAEVWRLSGAAFAPYLTAEVAYREGRFEKAVELLGALLDRPEVRDAARVLSARALRELERYDDAAAMLLPLQGDEESTLLLGLVLSDAGKAKEALPAFRELAESHPSEPDYAYFEGRAHQELGDAESAREAYERALLAPSGHDNAFAALVELDLLAKQSGAAKSRVEEALAGAPQDARLLLLLGRVEESAGRVAEAEQAYRKAVQLDSSSASARRQLGLLLAKRGLHEDARAHIDRSLVGDPENLGTLMIAGMLSERLGEARAAMRYYRELLDHHPEFYPAANNLAYLYAEQGIELPEALRLAEIAVAARPDHAGFNDTLGLVLLRLGRPEKAHRHLKLAATRAPDRAMIWVHLGMAEERLERRADAIRAYESAARLSEGGEAGAQAEQALRRLGVVKPR